MKDFLIASFFAGGAFCAAVAGAQHASLAVVATQPQAVVAREEPFIPPSFDIEMPPPQQPPVDRTPSAADASLID